MNIIRYIDRIYHIFLKGYFCKFEFLQSCFLIYCLENLKEKYIKSKFLNFKSFMKKEFKNNKIFDEISNDKFLILLSEETNNFEKGTFSIEI